MKIYIAGSMSSAHSEDRQFALFNSRAKHFREKGHEVNNPAEQVVRDGFGSWSDAIRNCMRRVYDCDAIHILPIWKAAGPVLEYFAAVIGGLKVVDEEGRDISPPAAALSAGEIREIILRHG